MVSGTWVARAISSGVRTRASPNRVEALRLCGVQRTLRDAFGRDLSVWVVTQFFADGDGHVVLLFDFFGLLSSDQCLGFLRVGRVALMVSLVAACGNLVAWVSQLMILSPVALVAAVDVARCELIGEFACLVGRISEVESFLRTRISRT